MKLLLVHGIAMTIIAVLVAVNVDLLRTYSLGESILLMLCLVVANQGIGSLWRWNEERKGG